MAIGTLDKISDLRNSTDSRDLITHHKYVQDYYDKYNNKRETAHDFVRGNHFNSDELQAFKNKRKTPVVFNTIKVNERTILGTFIQNKYDVKFSPTEETDQDISDRLEKLRIWESNQQKDKTKDVDLVREAWAGGNSFQECYMDTMQGKEPVMKTSSLNPFAVYWDPDSRVLVTREDALFVDIETWMSKEQLLNAFPDKKDVIMEGLTHHSGDSSGYESVDVYKDRSHEDRNEKNDKYKIIERFYKVNDAHFYSYDDDGERTDIGRDDIRAHSEDFPDRVLNQDSEETLFLAISCESMSYHDYLFNDKYHAQPRDPHSGRILWPILELVAESLGGEPSGFVEHEQDPAKAYDSMISNILHAAKHSSSNAKLIDSDAFKTENDAKNAAKYHSDADRAFPVRPGRASDAMLPVQKSSVSNDVYQGLALAKEFQDEIGSTPPALQGHSEGSSTSGVLNAQRIEQSYIQLQVMILNYRIFLEARNNLRYAYWREFYTGEKVFRVTNDESGENEFYKINEQSPEIDAYGYETGGVTINWDIKEAVYDITVEDSFKSPTFRYKTQQQIAEMMQTEAVRQDPVLMQFLALEWVRLSDASTELKTGVKEHASIMQQWQAQKQSAESDQQAMQTKQMQQQIAQTEAEQTVPSIPPVEEMELMAESGAA